MRVKDVNADQVVYWQKGGEHAEVIHTQRWHHRV